LGRARKAPKCSNKPSGTQPCTRFEAVVGFGKYGGGFKDVQ